VKKDLAEHDYNALDEVLYKYLLEDEQELSVGETLMVYFGTPNKIITL
jgi:hypothetical protein